MEKKLKTTELLKAAELSALMLSDAEVKQLQKELAEILACFDRQIALPEQQEYPEEVGLTSPDNLRNNQTRQVRAEDLRPDKSVTCRSINEFLRQSPNFQDDYFII